MEALLDWLEKHWGWLLPLLASCIKVKPMEVSMHFPPFTAVMEEPFPMWQVMIFVSSTGLSSSFAISAATKRWEVPCAP